MKPILFNTEMVRAILEGRKTVTRMVVKPQPLDKPMCFHDPEEGLNIVCHVAGMDVLYNFFPPYQPGDTLWVRETWNGDWCDHYIYKADGGSAKAAGYAEEPKWRPSIHMPKEAARLFLRVTDVRVERLQDITDYRAEGIHPSEACEECFAVRGGCDPLNSPTGCDNEIDAFAGLWDRTVKPADLPLYGWEANPWVFVIEFERISKDEALGGGGDAN